MIYLLKMFILLIKVACWVALAYIGMAVLFIGVGDGLYLLSGAPWSEVSEEMYWLFVMLPVGIFLIWALLNVDRINPSYIPPVSTGKKLGGIMTTFAIIVFLLLMGLGMALM